MRSLIAFPALALSLSLAACDAGPAPDVKTPGEAAPAASHATGSDAGVRWGDAGATWSDAGTTSEAAATRLPGQPMSPPATAEVQKLAQASNAFGFDLYQRLRQAPGNTVFSPASITTALAMAWGGARGETAAQMKKVLHLDGSAEEVMSTSGRLAASLQDPSRPITFRIANQLFGQERSSFQQPFLDAMQAAYGAPLEHVDFNADPELARARINGWVAEKTDKRIEGLIPPGAISGGTRLVLVNALYFLGDWEYPFERAYTRDAAFSTGAGTRKDVPTMIRADAYNFVHQDGMKAVELPYNGREMSMLLVLPDAVDGLDALEESLDAGKLAGLAGALKPAGLRVALPRFEVAPAASLSLARELHALGMHDAFHTSKADFSGIASGLSVGDVFHKAFVKVGEKGTEAAAATSVGMKMSAQFGNPQEVKFDHPFLFFIRDNASGLVLFMGRVADPAPR